MKANKIFYAIVIISCALLALPLSAQDDWPEDCQLLDLEEEMGAANDARADGDVAAFVLSRLYRE